MDETLEVEIEGHRLAAVLTHACCTGIPVFFLHGIGSCLHFWTPELTSAFHHLGPCYALSLPGHFPAVFPKDFPAECLSAELIARLMGCAIQRIAGSQKVLLVGHSTGGFAALSTAIYHPETIAAVVSIAGFAKGQWTGALGLNQWLVRQGSLGGAMFKRVYQLGGTGKMIYRMYWHVYVKDHISLWKHPHVRTVLDATFPHFRHLDTDAMVSYFRVMPDTDITSALSKITVPVYLITGDQDPIVPTQQSATIAEKVTNARLAILKGAGHLPFFEKPEDYQKAIDNALTYFQAL